MLHGKERASHHGTREDVIRLELGVESGPREWIRALPGDALEPHPLVQELRRTIHAKDEALARTEREIARLRVAVAFGLAEVPQGSGRALSPEDR